MSKKECGKEYFDSYYQQKFGDRWVKLRESLFQEPLYGKFISNSIQENKEYFLDAGSIIAALSLPLGNAKHILDMCAAPGGKSLFLASRMDNDALLLCNERSQERRNRLINNLRTYLPQTVFDRITCTGYDGAIMCKKNQKFDAILLDAPCSSERHVITSEKHLDIWTQSRIKNLSFTQWSLLSSAFLMLENKGFLLYATCALSEQENDLVVQKLIKKYDSACTVDIDVNKIVEYALEKKYISKTLEAEKTGYGYHILPDKQGGAGPLFFSLLTRDDS